MSVTVAISHDQSFRDLSHKAVIANNYDTSTEESRDRFDNMMLSYYEGDTLSPAPECSCGHLKGAFYLGDECEFCGEVVTEVFATDIESIIWLIPLPGTHAFISPLMWQMMQRLMIMDGVDCLRYLTDPYYRPPAELPFRLKYLMEQGHHRGLNYFYENFDRIIREFVEFNGKLMTPEPLITLTKLVSFNRDKIFTKILPVPNRTMFPIEKTGNANYGDKNMVNIKDAICIVQESESRKDTLTLKQQESRMVKVIEQFAQFHYEYIKNSMGSKYGSARQHLFGGRWHNSSRAVIVSIYEPHDFREVHFPWAVAMEQFYVLLANKLIHRGHTLYEVYDLLKRYATTYNEYIAEIFQELIDESPFIGLPIILQRNPTIRRPSAILVYITKAKSNDNDHTISVSVGNLAGMNADFDGDQLNTVALQDITCHNNFIVLSPDYNVMDLSNPWELSGNLALQAPVVSTTASWLSHGRKAAYGEK